MEDSKKYYWIRKVYRKIHRYFLRKRLKNHDFTLLAPTCIAGVMYHELGMPFLSPTINLWMYDKDFVKFGAICDIIYPKNCVS